MNKADGVTLDGATLNAREAQDIAAKLVGIDPWRRMGYKEQDLAKRIGSACDTDRSLSIMTQGIRVGLIRIRERWLFGPLISIFAIFPEYQGRGIGRQALVCLERQGQQQRDQEPPDQEPRDQEQRGQTEWSNLWLTVSTFNQSALAFYRRCGFAQVGLLEGLVGDSWDEILLRKRILRRPAAVAPIC